MNPADILKTYLRQQKEMGLPEILVDKEITPSSPPSTSASHLGLPPSPPLDQNAARPQQLVDHYNRIKNCQLCGLGKTRTNFVYGRGNPEASLLFIGEAPGEEEDKQGKAFVGAAGQLLDKMISAMEEKGLKKGDWFIANILKCRPPANRTPAPEERKKCLPFLEEQMAILQPKLICCLGGTAAQALLQTDESVGRLRGRVHQYKGRPVIVTYHPSYLVRSEGSSEEKSRKTEAWKDLQLVLQTMAKCQ